MKGMTNENQPLGEVRKEMDLDSGGAYVWTASQTAVTSKLCAKIKVRFDWHADE